MVLLGQEHCAVVEQVGIRVVSVDQENFGDVSASRPTFDMYHHVQGVSDVRLNRASVFFHDRCVATERTVNFEPLLFRA